MKKNIFLFLSFIILLQSCSSDSDVIETATDSNLSDISLKLENLKIDKIQEQQSSNTEIDSEISFSKISKIETRSKLSNDVDTYCNHEEKFTENFNGETLEVTLKYFDKDGNISTICDIEDNTTYITEQTSKVTGSNYVYDWFTTTTHKQSVQYTSTTYSLDIEANSDLIGTLNFDGDIFNIVEGSYLNLFLFFEYDSNQEFSDEIYMSEIDLLYKIEFDTNGETYHFEMSLNDENFNDTYQSFESQHLLFNSSNKKIGIVKYIYNSDNQEEYFEVYDLNGDKV